MTLQSSGAITLADIQAEFGGPTSPILLSNYYRGGSYVPDVVENAAIPTSGTIYLTNFYGATARTFPSYQDTYIVAVGFGAQEAGIQFRSEGDVRQLTTSLGYVTLGNWTSPAATGIGSSYEIYASWSSLDGSTAGSSAVNTWLSLSTFRYWQVRGLLAGEIAYGALAIQIRDTATSTVRASYSIILEAERFS